MDNCQFHWRAWQDSNLSPQIRNLVPYLLGNMLDPEIFIGHYILVIIYWSLYIGHYIFECFAQICHFFVNKLVCRIPECQYHRFSFCLIDNDIGTLSLVLDSWSDWFWETSIFGQWFVISIYVQEPGEEAKVQAYTICFGRSFNCPGSGIWTQSWGQEAKTEPDCCNCNFSQCLPTKVSSVHKPGVLGTGADG